MYKIWYMVKGASIDISNLTKSIMQSKHKVCLKEFHFNSMSHRSQLSTSRHSALFSQVAFHILRDFSPLGILWLGTKQPLFESEIAQTCVQRFCSEKMLLWSVDFKCGHSKMFRSENSSNPHWSIFIAPNCQFWYATALFGPVKRMPKRT